MTDFSKLVERMTPLLGPVETHKFINELTALGVGGHEPWKKAVIALAANALDKYGHDGINVALTALDDIKNGKVPKIDWADLETASDILATLQNAEASRKSAAYDFLVKLSAVFTPLIKILLASLL